MTGLNRSLTAHMTFASESIWTVGSRGVCSSVYIQKVAAEDFCKRVFNQNSNSRKQIVQPIGSYPTSWMVLVSISIITPQRSEEFHLGIRLTGSNQIYGSRKCIWTEYKYDIHETPTSRIQYSYWSQELRCVHHYEDSHPVASSVVELLINYFIL